MYNIIAMKKHQNTIQKLLELDKQLLQEIKEHSLGREMKQ